MTDLFSHQLQNNLERIAPLADRMRPRTLDNDTGLASDHMPAVLADNLTQWSKTPS